MCEGCPAEIITQNIAKHREGTPSHNGTIAYIAVSDIAKVAIMNGATTFEDILPEVERTAWTDEDQRYGDLTAKEIIEATVLCSVRWAKGECGIRSKPVIPIPKSLEQEVAERRSFTHIPPPSARPTWMDEKPVERFKPLH